MGDADCGLPAINGQSPPRVSAPPAGIHVLGEATFTTAASATGQSGMNTSQGVALVASASCLFVADTNIHRVAV